MIQIPLAFVIEDQPKLAMFYEDALRLIGYDVQVIRTGLDAVNTISVSDPPTLIILDVNLPQVSGHEVYKQIRNAEPYHNTRVIITTANTVMAEKIRPELAAGDHLLVKPVGVMILQQLAKEIRAKAAQRSTAHINPKSDKPSTTDPD